MAQVIQSEKSISIDETYPVSKDDTASIICKAVYFTWIEEEEHNERKVQHATAAHSFSLGYRVVPDQHTLLRSTVQKHIQV